MLFIFRLTVIQLLLACLALIAAAQSGKRQGHTKLPVGGAPASVASKTQSSLVIPQEECALKGDTHFDFGLIDADSMVAHVFTLTNTSSHAVAISRVIPSCGCTAALLSDTVVQTGHNVHVSITFKSPKGSRGIVSKSVTLKVAGQEHACAILRFTAAIRTEFELFPRHVELSDAIAGIPVRSVVTISNTTDAPLEIMGMHVRAFAHQDSTDEVTAIPETHVSVSESSFELDPGEIRKVQVTITPPCAGFIDATLQLRTRKSEEEVGLSGRVKKASESGKPRF